MREVKDIFNINPKYTTTSAFIIGLILMDNLTYAEQNALGEWLILLGQTIVSNSGFQQVIEQRINNYNININSKKYKSIYNPGIYNITKAREIFKKLYPDCKNDINELSKIINELQNQINKIKKE